MWEFFTFFRITPKGVVLQEKWTEQNWTSLKFPLKWYHFYRNWRKFFLTFKTLHISVIEWKAPSTIMIMDELLVQQLLLLYFDDVRLKYYFTLISIAVVFWLVELILHSLLLLLLLLLLLYVPGLCVLNVSHSFFSWHQVEVLFHFISLSTR